MKNLLIDKTAYTPKVDFNYQSNELSIIGISYPENTAKFYSTVISWLERYIEKLDKQKVVFNMEVSYFNSSTSKVFMDIFDCLDEAAESGRNIVVNWKYKGEDEIIEEHGVEFREDLHAMTFNLVKMD